MLTESELIERIYNIALEPNSYDDFMEKWDGYISEAVSSLTALQADSQTAELSNETLERHFEMGFRLLEELGRSNPATFFARQGKSAGAASLLINEQGHVVWYNGAAGRFFGLARLAGVDRLPLWAGSRARLSAMIAELGGTQAGGEEKSVLRLQSEAASKTVYMLAEFVSDGSREKLILVREIVSSWQEGIGRMLTESFGLSSAEVEIAERLVEGARVGDIAEERSSSVNTVRTQVKSLLSKTGTGTQTDLVRLLLSLNRLAEEADTGTPRASHGQPFSFRQSDGRHVPYHVFGPQKGKPFLYVHGMLFGCDLTRQTIDLLHQYDVTLIAPERPYFGSAEGSPGNIADAPERFAADMENLLDYLQIDRVGLFGNMAGSVYAFAAAARLGDRAAAIVNVAAGVPLVSNDQIAAMTPRQQLVAYTARYTPKLLPFVLRAGIRQIDFGGERNFMHALYEHAPHDLAAVGNEEIAAIVCSGYHFTIAQGHRSFEIDAYHVVRDWTSRVEASSAPIILIHGRHDPVVTARSVEAFHRRLGQRSSLVIDENAGQLLLHVNPELVVRQLAAVQFPASG